MSYIIGKDCSTCHYCAMECPEKAIRFVGVEYAIDPEKCSECGICAEVCPSGIIYHPDEVVKTEKHDLITKACDLVVLGAGGSGLVAAVRAAQLTGKKVIVLEKAKKPGGNSNLAHGFIMRYTKLHEAAGLPDTREEFINRLYEGSNKKLDYDLIRKSTYALGDMFDWLCGFGGWEEYFALKYLPPMDVNMVDFPKRSFENLKCTDHSMGPGWMGTYVIRKMLEQADKLGIEIYTGHRAAELLVDENGTFKGVMAEDAGGQTRIDAKCCILATGGFSRSREIMDMVRPTFYQDFPVHSFAVASCTGDAITMAEKIGAGLDLETVKIPMFGPTHHPYNYGMVRLVGNPEAVMVDTSGRRFQNEGGRPEMSFMSIMEKLPGKIAYTIIDDNTLDIMGQRGIQSAGGDPEMAKSFLNYREQIEEEAKLDLAAKKANSIEELAALIGIEPIALKAEIDRYNSFCANGKDEDFGKEAEQLVPIVKAPFYALFLSRFNEGAVGGIINDNKLRVTDKTGKPFKGLYAIGDCCKGLLKTDDAGGKFGEMPWAMASGYMAGQEAAEYLGGE
ncbi:MAG: FAD-dependent oxidoreductase [Clostridiales bacterium]|nr:FAD-dependent oxidoreductase [Clostridiales bacterium]